MSRLNEAIKVSGLKKGHIARELDIDRSTLTRWCNSGRVPDDDMKTRIAVLVARPVAWLFFGEACNCAVNKSA